MTRRWLAAFGAVSAVACLGALPVPLDPTHPEVAEAWVNPAIRPGEGAKGELLLIDAPLTTTGTFTARLRVTNHSTETLEGLTVTPRRGPATGSAWDQRVATVASISEYAVVGERHDLHVSLRPGASVEFALDVELPMAGVGAYPVLLQLADSTGTLDTERFHITSQGPLPDGIAPAGMSALYPISAPVDILPGETGDAPADPPLVLASEELAAQIAPGGRLDQLVETYLGADPEVGAATCAALDPALIDAVDRMSRGYTVAERRAPAVEEPKRLRDSWGDGDKAAAGTPGTGAEDAAAWLSKVRAIATRGCTVALPWANTDINAVVRTGDPWLVREALERGPFTLQRVLGTAGTMNVVVPDAGYVTQDAVAALGWADHSRSTIPTEGLSGSWERAVVAASDAASGPGSAPTRDAGASHGTDDETSSGGSSLEARDLAAPAWAAAPAPEQPVRVLVAAGTVDSAPAPTPAPGTATAPGTAPGAERFAWAAPGILAVRFQDAVGGTWGGVGKQPLTLGYSNEALRFDYALDSPRARAINAAAGLQLAAQAAWTYGEQPAAEPVLVNPPASWEASDAAVMLGTLAHLMDTGAARPVTLAEYLTVPEGAAVPDATRVGTPFTDPTVYADSEILAATQQAAFINDLGALLAPDPNVALTRYGFTLPLRRDILTAFAPAGRRSLEGYSGAVGETAARLSGSRATLGELRSGISLIPPGNVYTRTSPTSPLLIVAQNGMPLPVDAAIRYTAPEGSTLHVPEPLRIPARGSVTVQMTADLPQNARGTNLQLYLASPQGRAISRPVEISVRTPTFALRGWVLLAAGAALLALVLLYSVAKRARGGGGGPPPRGANTHPRRRSP